jgi:hypothetical protein
MFNLVRSIFSGAGNHRSAESEQRIADAIERVIDGTDPRLRYLPHYRKRLRDPVIHAIAHAGALTAAIPPALGLDARSYGTEPRLAALFSSPEEMFELFGREALTRDLPPDPYSSNGLVTFLLLAERSERRVLGVDLEGEQLLRDVDQVAVNFSRQRLRAPGADEPQTRERVSRRALAHLLGLARARFCVPPSVRDEPARQGVSPVQWNRPRSSPAWPLRESSDPNRSIGTVDLARRLDDLADLLARAEDVLWCERRTLYLDAMNIKRDPHHAWVRRLEFPEFVNARGRRVVALLIALQPGDFQGRRPVSARFNGRPKPTQ